MDKRLKYNTAILLLRNHQKVPDTIWTYFAGLDEYRYELYSDLKRLKQLSVYPAAQKNNIAIARSQILYEQDYNKPDTIAFLEKVPLNYKERAGLIYVFKYKDKKTDNHWKLATVGLLPANEQVYSFDETGKKRINEFEYNFSEFTQTKLVAETPEKEQVQKLIKKLVYGKRKSAAQFYTDDNDYNVFDYSQLRD